MANEVLTALQDLDLLGGKQKALLALSDEQTALLHGLMLRWSGSLARDLAGFDLGAYTRDPDLTFDVVQKALSLKLYVQDEGGALPYREALLAELHARIESADTAAKASYGARVALQEKQREVRELTATFHRELVSLRRSVRATLGSSHLDYQRLRVTGKAATVEPPSDEPQTTQPSTTETETASAVPPDAASARSPSS
jgi:hypothetical protein